MCGILCCYKCCCSDNKRLMNRGPDHQASLITGSNVKLAAFILHVQGHTKQPCTREKRTLLYNGQIFKYDEEFYSSDTIALMDSLVNDGVLKSVRKAQGPCAVIYYDENEDILWFWRDYFGRRSLLIAREGDGYILCSVGDSTRQWHEVPAGTVFCLQGDGGDGNHVTQSCHVTCHAYQGRKDVCLEFASRLFDSVSIAEGCIPSPVSPLNSCLTTNTPLQWEDKSVTFLHLLSESVKMRDHCCHHPLPFTKSTLSDYTARHCYCSSSTRCTVHEDDITPSGARVGVLFSGGIDCTVLAALLHRFVPIEEPIDLVNVSFGKFDTTPDRISALASLLDLTDTCPGRQWNLIKVNVSRDELQSARDRYISDLLYPHNTVLDDSIGCALWFAARGVGYCARADDVDQWMFSTARLLFSGIGADELLGGYSRHRGAWQNGGGMEGVIKEISLDIDRISERNLGRDNRVIGDHRRDCVAPYLDEEFVSFVNSLPIQYKVDYTRPRGEGEKIILRRVAETLGLKSSSVLPKKAIQFGSKIAKLEGRKEKGSDVCGRLVKRKDK